MNNFRKLIRATASLILVITFFFIIFTIFMSAFVGCIWLWRHWITGGFYV